MSELEELTACFSSAGGEVKALADAGTGHLAVSGHSILSSRMVHGLMVDAREIVNGISAKVTVEKGIKLEHPVHLCFGVLH